MSILKKENKKYTVTLIFFIILITWYKFPLVQKGFFEHISSYIAYPVIKIYAQFIDPLKIQWQNKKTEQELQLLIKKLNKEKSDLQEHIVLLSASKNRFDNTQDLRTFQERYTHNKGRIVHIMVRHFSDQGHYILVDSGSKQGTTVDMVAVVHNCLVGRVVNVYPWYSKINLITDKTCKISAMTTDGRIPGIHEGTNNEKTLLRYVSPLQKVQEGDLVLSSGQGLVFPQGFALGTVEKVTANTLYQEIIINPFINLKQLDYCILLAKGDITPSFNKHKK